MRGISRVAVEVVILLLAVSLVLIFVTPLSSVVFQGVSSAAGASSYTLEIVGVTPTGRTPGGTDALVIYVKNPGPRPIPLELGIWGDEGNVCWFADYSWDPRFRIVCWPAAVQNRTGMYVSMSCWLARTCFMEVAGNGDDLLDPGETWAIYYPNMSQPQTERFEVRIIGPEGTISAYVYWPP